MAGVPATAVGTVTPIVQAAGGVVWRHRDGGVEVCLVHRPRMDDWTLPKGKREPGESLLECAVREVGEESATVATPQVRLPGVRYRLPDGRLKRVDYWSMRARAVRRFTPGREIDAVWWAGPGAAARRLSYVTDREVLAAFSALPPITVTVLAVRAAGVASRADRDGRAGARALSRDGRDAATQLAATVRLLAPGYLLAAPQWRCRETLAPASALTGVDVETVVLDRAAVSALARAGRSGVVCTTGSALRGILDDLGWAAEPVPSGRGLLLAFCGDRLVAADPV